MNSLSISLCFLLLELTHAQIEVTIDTNMAVVGEDVTVACRIPGAAIGELYYLTKKVVMPDGQFASVSGPLHLRLTPFLDV